MEERNVILPGSPRYQPKKLQPFFGYDNLYREAVEVELATLYTLAEIGVISEGVIKKLTPEITEELLSIATTEVDRVEREITKHDIRALVRIIQKILIEKDAPELAQWVHIPLTSYDPLDTGRILQFRKAYERALKPSLEEVVLILAELTRRFAGQIQIGRTHGRHALPITVGFWLATILNRIINNWQQMDDASKNLVGKISGAVGAHNAQIAMKFNVGEETFEERVLKKLGLKPAPISTQILPPEPLVYFLFSCTMMSATFGQFGRDGRNLMRNEIGEIAEAFEEEQVGSSTMAHKRNPINFENLEGMWLRTKSEFGKVLDTLTSEHQRDLTGSSVIRDFPIIVVNLQQQMNTLLRKNKAGVPFLKRLTVDSSACARNFKTSAKVILAEPLYIALQMAGFEGDGHEFVNRKLVPMAQRGKISLKKAAEFVAQSDEKLARAISNVPPDVWRLLGQPQKYLGDAKEKALEIADEAESFIKSLHYAEQADDLY